MADYKEELKELLRELFQFDYADLDFGIYRIMNHKRKEIEKFIEEDLIEAVDAAFEKYAIAGRNEIEKEIVEIKKKIEENIAKDAFDTTTGEIKKEYRKTSLAQQYYTKKEEQAAADAAEQQKAEIFSHIYQFFSRYYHEGDFLSLRRYSKENKYAIPYNGEEVLLHWANNDQYYIKTGEHFQNYSFRAGDFKVSFRVSNAEIDQNNVKSDKRYFVLKTGDGAINFDPKKKELTIYFEYRGLTDDEEEYGKQNIQENIVGAINEEILAGITDSGLKSSLGKSKDGKTFLEKHLNKYTKKNTTDYFIHKDLKGFLTRELDFYIKNEIFNLDDLGSGKETSIEKYITRVKVIKEISKKIIEFLAQIEEFQKNLWEKKKFVIRTDYCITLDKVPEEFYEEISSNEAQINEWKDLFKLEEIERGTLKYTYKRGLKFDVEFLKNSPFLVLDTKFFDRSFKERLLATFEDLDNEIGGEMIKSENLQALNLLQEKYREKVKCIYIDPPYNTGSDEFIYKDTYQHSSWLIMMANRLEKSMDFLTNDGCLFSSIDDNESSNLEKLFSCVFGPMRFEASFDIKVRHEERLLRKDIPYQKVNEKLHLVSKTSEFKPSRILNSAEEDDSKDYEYEVRINGKPSKVETIGNYEVEIYPAPQVKVLKKSPGSRLLKRYTIRGSLITQKGSASEFYEIFLRQRLKNDGYGTLYKVIGMGLKGDGLGYRYIMQPEKGKGKNGIYFQGFPIAESKSKGLPQPTFFDFVEEFNFCADEGGIKFSNGKKPIAFLAKVLEIANVEKKSVIMDYFAGSGSTAHAVLNLNKEDGGNRKYIVVEMGEYFDTATKPRIQNVMFSKDWKDGKPTSKEGFSHMFKYQWLEQYEDALNNIEFMEAGAVQKSLEDMGDYFLKYMLDFETRGSPTRLNVDKFSQPFNYKLKILNRDNEMTEEVVDLVETFNYLLGLHVKRIRAFNNNGTYYWVVFGSKGEESIAVIWRNSDGLDLKTEKEFIEGTVLKDIKPDIIYINGDSYLENARPIEPEFKRLMGG